MWVLLVSFLIWFLKLMYIWLFMVAFTEMKEAKEETLQSHGSNKLILIVIYLFGSSGDWKRNNNTIYNNEIHAEMF